jgi:hypothetical protein
VEGGGLALVAVGAGGAPGPTLLGAPAIVDEVLIDAVGWFAGVPGGGSSGPIRPQPASASARNVKEKKHVTRDATAGS